MLNIISHWGNCKLKQNTTTDLLEWQNSKILTTPNAGKDVEQQELSAVAGGNVKWYSYIGRQLGSFLQSKHNLTI